MHHHSITPTLHDSYITTATGIRYNSISQHQQRHKAYITTANSSKNIRYHHHYCAHKRKLHLAHDCCARHLLDVMNLRRGLGGNIEQSAAAATISASTTVRSRRPLRHSFQQQYWSKTFRSTRIIDVQDEDIRRSVEAYTPDKCRLRLC
jgi:hypothetical protein